METQPTQPGLMQIFSDLGLAAEDSATALNEQSLEGEGFAGLLSGFLPSHLSKATTATTSGLLPLEAESEALQGELAISNGMDKSLPLSGQVLPLGGVYLDSASSNSSSLDSTLAQTLTAPVIDVTNGIDSINKTAEGNNLDKLTFGQINASVNENENNNGGSTSVSQALEKQGFHAQSLVSSVMGNNEVTKSNSAPNLGNESIKSAYVSPQQMGNSLRPLVGDLKMMASSQNVTAGIAGEVTENLSDRFLGAQSLEGLVKPKVLAPIESPAASPIQAMAQSSSVVESTLGLALAMNEDPTIQTLDELIDGEVIEEAELKSELKSLERKQDDQTLKLSKGQQAWGDALTERITMNVAQDIKQVTIHLDPPELGSLELKMKVNDDQQTQVLVQVQNPQVKEALESSAHRLRDMLANEGLELSEFDVHTDAGRDDQLSQNSEERAQEQSRDSDAQEELSEEIAVDIPKAKNNNLLDTFV